MNPDSEHKLRLIQITECMHMAQAKIANEQWYEALVELDTAKIILKAIKFQANTNKSRISND